MNGHRISALVATLLVVLLSFASAAPGGPAVSIVVSDNPCC